MMITYTQSVIIIRECFYFNEVIIGIPSMLSHENAYVSKKYWTGLLCLRIYTTMCVKISIKCISGNPEKRNRHKHVDFGEKEQLSVICNNLDGHKLTYRFCNTKVASSNRNPHKFFPRKLKVRAWFLKIIDSNRNCDNILFEKRKFAMG